VCQFKASVPKDPPSLLIPSPFISTTTLFSSFFLSLLFSPLSFLTPILSSDIRRLALSKLRNDTSHPIVITQDELIMAKAEVSPLQRGKACLRCRKRKMKCNGVKPSCQQCLKAGKEDCCEYDDGKTKTRTQIMRETIDRLEQRVRELEEDGPSSSLAPAFESHQRSLSSSSSSSSASFPGSPESFESSPYNSEISHSPSEPWTQLPLTPSPSPPFPDVHDDNTPIELSHMLLDIFAPHRHQCALDLHMDRLRSNVFLPLNEQRHPALMNSIFLWACFVSRPQALSGNEEHYLNLTLDGINDALRSGDRLLDVIQASCLIAKYFLANGRYLEGSYHIGAAASLAVQCGLHRPLNMVGEEILAPYPFTPAPAQDTVEQGERTLLFWQCYNLDRCYSVLLQKPAVIPDNMSTHESINVPWPKSISEYEMGLADSTADCHTVKSFLTGVLTSDFSAGARRAKASTLLYHAYQVSMSLDTQITPPASPIDALRPTDILISQYISSLPSMASLSMAVPDDKYILITCHIIAQCSIIYLHHLFAAEDAMCYQRCLSAARECVRIVTSLCEADFMYIDPVIGPCWGLVSDTLIRELDSIDAAWPLLDNMEIRSELGVLLYAMNSFHARFACIGTSIGRVQKRLAGEI
jgi:hypothetical protein